MKNLIRKILKESKDERLYKSISSTLKPPYFKNLIKIYNINKDEIEFILPFVFNQPVEIHGKEVFDKKGETIYKEYITGEWIRKEYDKNGNMIHREDDSGEWEKNEYDEKGNRIYFEDSDGYWVKSKYDKKGNEIYWEDSDGYWVKRTFDKKGIIINTTSGSL